MTEFTLPPFVLPYGGWWIEVDLEGDLAAWARRSAGDVLARWGDRNGRHARKLAGLLEAAGRVTREKQQGAILALLLYPSPGEGIRAGTLVFPVDMSGHDEASGWEAVTGGLVPPERWAELSPEVTDIATPAGTCRRIRTLEAHGDAGAPVIEHLMYVWMFARYGAAIVMSTTFQSLAEAGRWRSAVEELATSAELDETVGTPPR